MNGQKDYEIVEAPSVVGEGRYFACGKCGARLNVGQRDQDTRDEMAKVLDEKVLDPFGLLAGLMANTNDEDSEEVSIGAVGYLLGLMVHGARKEFEVQRVGGVGVYWLKELIEGHSKE
jgi:hypothetical protein